MIGSYLVYGMILVLATICGYRIERSETVQQERTYRFLLFLVFWLPAISRYGIGTDYMQYVLIYDFINETEHIEIGFKALCLLLNWLGADSFWLFVVVGALTYAPFCFGLPRKMMYSGTFLFVCAFYLSTYSVIRQTLAVSLVLYASYQLLEGREKRFLLITAIASCFHLSVLIVLPLYLLRRIATKRFAIFILCLIAIVLMLSSSLVTMFFSNSIVMASPYGRYADSEFFMQETQLGTGLGLLSRMLFPAFMLFFIKPLAKEYKNAGYITLICLAFIVSGYLTSQIYIFNRIGDIFRFVPVLCFSLWVSSIQTQYKKPITTCLVLLYIMLYFMDQYRSSQSMGGGLGIMPYQTIWDDLF